MKTDEIADDVAETFAGEVFDAYRNDVVLLTQINMLSEVKYDHLDDVPREVLYNVLAMFLMALGQVRHSNRSDERVGLTEDSSSS